MIFIDDCVPIFYSGWCGIYSAEPRQPATRWGDAGPLRRLSGRVAFASLLTLCFEIFTSISYSALTRALRSYLVDKVDAFV